MDKRDVLTAFLQAWMEGDYGQMYEFAQKTWQKSHTVDHIKVMFQDAKVKEFNSFSNTYVSPAAHKYNVDITMENGGRVMAVIVVICETAPFKPAAYGVWGVNPGSVQNVVGAIPAQTTKRQEKDPGEKQAETPKPKGKPAAKKKPPIDDTK